MANVGNASLNDAQKKLVEENMNLVYSQAHKMGITSHDLIQEGMIGLINAARFYSPDFFYTDKETGKTYQVKFSTYAGSYIWSALHGTYSQKKNVKKQANTCSLDDPDLSAKLQALADNKGGGFFEHLSLSADPMADRVVRAICDGFTKREVKIELNLSSSRFNSIIDKVGRELYAERYAKQES